jgi:hypothetical protein
VLAAVAAMLVVSLALPKGAGWEVPTARPLALVCVALIAYEVMRHREDRAAIRSRG